MHTRELLIRCLAEFDGQQWTAVSLEFGLAAQADTFEEVRALLDSQIRSYVYDALVGEDRVHSRYLLMRRAPLAEFVKYYFACAMRWLNHKITDHEQRTHKLFTETLPLQPA